jgi:hypothetical protein
VKCSVPPYLPELLFPGFVEMVYLDIDIKE